MIVFLFMMMVITYADRLERCIKHCVMNMNQCMKTVKRQRFLFCEDLCKKTCNKNHIAHKEFITVSPNIRYYDEVFGVFCKNYQTYEKLN